MTSEPRIVSRSTTRNSPWIELIARSVDFGRGTAAQTYHAINQADYVGISAMTPDGRSAVVRQYRPAVERHTWEFPAGMVDGAEDAAATCVRELKGGDRAFGPARACIGHLRARHGAIKQCFSCIFRGDRGAGGEF